jgi:hypothetical protein
MTPRRPCARFIFTAGSRRHFNPKETIAMRFNPVRVGSSLGVVFAAAVIAGCSADHGGGASVTPPEVPEALRVPDGNSPFLKAPASGSQIYTCQASADQPGAYAWTFKAPDAVLFDANGAKIGTHYAGPTWESIDTSKVVGTVKAKADSPNKNAVPILLLQTKSTEGTGTFAKVTYVQRLNTAGGAAPAAGCDAAHAGQDMPVAYTADYYFYEAR